jgi:dimeric dUTPase (all-alpha-NTP-PPase superfamily)
MKHFYQDIDGFMNKENILLFDKVLDLMPPECCWIELGAWTGKSVAYSVVELINKKKFGKFFAVDSWQGCEILQKHELVKSNLVKDVFLKNISPLSDKIKIIENYSWKAAKDFLDESVDFCYVDADHSYEGVSKDLDAWWPKIKENSYFGGDDYTNQFPGVFSAVNDFFSKRNIKIDTVGRCWLVQKIN